MATEFMLYNVEEKDLFKNKPKEEREKLLYEMVCYAKKYRNLQLENIIPILQQLENGLINMKSLVLKV